LKLQFPSCRGERSPNDLAKRERKGESNPSRECLLEHAASGSSTETAYLLQSPGGTAEAPSKLVHAGARIRAILRTFGLHEFSAPFWETVAGYGTNECSTLDREVKRAIFENTL